MLQPFEFPRAVPEQLGLSSDAIAAFLDDTVQSGIEIHSFMILRHGQVAAEGAWAPYALDDPHILFSVSKSVTSTAIGFAVQEGLLTVDDPVISIFPEYVTAEIAANMAELRVKHLLAMATGHDVETGAVMRKQPEGDWVKAFFDTPIAYPPGTRFLYNSGASYMLSAIIQKLTAQSVVDYLRPRLFDPLGIDYALWETCPKGASEGASGLHLTLDSVARFGQLFLQRGMWNGRRLLSEAWIDEATAAHTDNNMKREEIPGDWNSGYGYQFWRCKAEGAYRADGAFGQFCYVLPERNAVIAILSGTNPNTFISDLVWKHLIPAMSDKSPEESARTETAPEKAMSLQSKIAGLSYLPERLQSTSPVSARVSGKRYELAPNSKGAAAVSFAFEAEECRFRLWDDRGEHEIRCGYGEWIVGETMATEDEWVKPVEVPWKLAASGTWHDDKTFVMTWRFVETTFTCYVRCRFEQEGISLHFTRPLTFDPYEIPPIEGAIR